MQESVNEFLKPRVVKVAPVNDLHAKVTIEPFRAWLWPYTWQCTAPNSSFIDAGSGSNVEAEIDRCACMSTPALKGVQEDVVDILLNLKQVAVRMHTRDTAELRMSQRRPLVVTGADIQLDHDVEIMNPEIVIANSDQRWRTEHGA